MDFIRKLSIAVAVTAAALTEAHPLNQFGYRDYPAQSNGNNESSSLVYSSSQPPILPISFSSNSTSGSSTSVPTSYTLPASVYIGPLTTTTAARKNISMPQVLKPALTTGGPLTIPAVPLNTTTSTVTVTYNLGNRTRTSSITRTSTIGPTPVCLYTSRNRNHPY